MYESIIDSLMSESSSEAFQRGLFTGFYAMEKCGVKHENIIKILENWESNYTDLKEYHNVVENYNEFVKLVDATLESYKD